MASCSICLSLTLHAKYIHQTSPLLKKSFSSLSILLLHTLPPCAPKYCIRCMVPDWALVWLPPRFLWIYKELVSIMNSLLNYWLLFTSLGFTVPFPPCFLSSITCPALTYLPVHLFRAFLTPSTLLFAQAVNLSAGGRAGARKEVGGLRETWEKQRDSGMPVRLRVSICASDLCVSRTIHVFVCLCTQSRTWTSGELAKIIFTQCANMPSPLHAYKKNAQLLSSAKNTDSHI